MPRVISPSILSADFGHLHRDVEMLNSSAAEWIHIDVMDGVFVPNISFGFPVVEVVRKSSTKCLDVHLMIVDPENYIERFAKAGSDYITIHTEATNDVQHCIDLIRKSGAKVGLSIKPATPVEVLLPYLDQLDLVLIMSVEPGFGGQKFHESSIEKVAQLAKYRAEGGHEFTISVDGGVSSANSEILYANGANVLVAGSAVFNAADPNAEMCKILATNI